MISYRTLFQVHIAHDYFLSRGERVFEALDAAEQAALAAGWSVPGLLDIAPDDTTVATLRGHKILFRPTETGFLAAVRIDPNTADQRPWVPPGAGFRLAFMLRLTDPRFANYTELGPTGAGFYRFGNDSQNSVAGTRFLSRRVSAFDATRRFVAGETHAQPAGATFDLFVALRDTGPAAAPVAADWRRIPADSWNPATSYAKGAVVLAANQVYRALVDAPTINLANAAEWQAVATLGNQYATVADAVRPLARLLTLDLAGLSLPQATVQLFRPGEALATVEQRFVGEAGPLASLQLDLRTLDPGPYRVELLDAARSVVPGRGFDAYLLPSGQAKRPFGVIDIVSGSGDFALFNPNGTLRSPRYVLRFLNRATRWRYIFPADQAVGGGADVAPEAGNPRVLVSAQPRPLTRFGMGSRLQADAAATSAVSEEILLPAPEANRVRLESTGWYSETHAANLTVGT